MCGCPGWAAAAVLCSFQGCRGLSWAVESQAALQQMGGLVKPASGTTGREDGGLEGMRGWVPQPWC